MKSSAHEPRFLLRWGYASVLGVGVTAAVVPVSDQTLGIRLAVLLGLAIATVLLTRCLLRAAGWSVEPRLEPQSFWRELPFAAGVFALFLVLAWLQATST